MFISMNWISDFVDLDGIDVKELISRFTLSTAEVEDIYEHGKDISGVVSAKIMSVSDHPSSKKLHILTVDDGVKTVQVVCGAPNVRENMVVPFARENAVVQGQKIIEAEIAGEKSFGMCMSEKELGISDNHGGLMELDPQTKLGTCIKALLPIEDTIFEVDNKSLTNRPDLWGHYGIAREISALAKRPLKPVAVAETEKYDSLAPIAINVLDEEKCLRYTGISIKNITARVTPAQMRIRLFYCGMRSINLLGDLTNYLMLELGQPMHAFDNALVDKITVKTFDKEFEFETLDNEKRSISPDTLMICKGDEPVAVAGVMGGLKSAISDDTTSVLLESATFDGVAVRKASSKLGLRTEASARYEKVIDPELTVVAAKRFLKLLQDIDGGIEVSSRMTDVYKRKYPAIKIQISKAYIDKYTGIDLSDETILDTLKSLDFGVSLSDGVFDVTVPTHRATKDVTIKADLIEEITRIYGYDNFEVKTTSTPLVPVRHSDARENEYSAKVILSQEFALNEVHSYIWYNSKLNKELGIETKDNVKIINSVSPETSVLREYIVPTLLGFAQLNKNNFSSINIFEIGKVVKGKKADSECNERKTLGILMADKALGEKDLFYKVKSAVNELASSIKNVHPEYSTIDENDLESWIHPYNSQSISLDGKKVGILSVLHPTVKNNLDKKLNVAFAELDFEVFTELSTQPVILNEISRFPGIDIDLSLLVSREMTYAETVNALSEYKNEFLQKFELVDVYENATIIDKKSVTMRFYFGSMERTLQSDEVDSFKQDLINLMQSKGAVVRTN